MSGEQANCCCGTPCCGRTNLPAVLYATVISATHCDCSGWVGAVIPLSSARHAQDENTVKIWAGCYNGPCTNINGVDVVQNMLLRLDCTVDEIGQAGSPSDLLLYKGVLETDGDLQPPCPDDLTGLIINTVPAIGGPQPGSTCSPLRLIFIIDSGELGYYCQDSMAPTGTSVWTIEITE